MSIDLSGKRVLVLGAETEVGRAVVTAIAEAGVSVAAVAATSEADAAFAVQRLARRLSSGERNLIAQAIDATNEAAVRVMVRQVSKELGGLDGVVSILTVDSEEALDAPVRWKQRQTTARLAQRYGGKELERGGGGKFVLVLQADEAGPPVFMRVPESDRRTALESAVIFTLRRMAHQVADEVVRAIAGEADSG